MNLSAPKIAFAVVLLITLGAPQTVCAQEEPSTPELSLFERTLPRDIATADLQELIIWARSLGLSDRGTRREVEDRILAYYGVARPPEEAQPEEGSTVGASGVSILRIERARGTDYFTLEEVDEQYLRIVGGVVLTLEEEGASHTIEAEEVTINLATDTLAAYGSVVYSVRREDGTENFRGDQIVFRIDTWEGIFVRGITESLEDDDEEEVFSVAGERISRSAGEIIVIDEGSITSSQADPPNFRIRAGRMWVLAPGEWALRDAVLYVGRVPLLYFPAFFLPGDRLFFSPAVGTRDREGAFIQTTTYLIGQREDQEPPLSIMRLGDAPEDSERVIEGLFLRIPEEPPPEDPEGWYLKIMADTYTTLGGYAGVAASLPDLGSVSTLDSRLGIGASRNIYYENGVYSNYYVQDGEALQHWNNGAFFGTSVPFRYEAELDTSMTFQGISLSIEFLLLSDPEFRRDFWNRDEGIDWSFLVQSAEEDEEETAEGASTVSSLAWTAALSWSGEVERLEPWIDRLSIDTFEADLQWRTRDNEELPDAVAWSTSDDSPEEEFFYPQSVLLPEIAMTVGGTLFQYPPVQTSGEESDTDKENNNEEDRPSYRDAVRPPWTEEGATGEEEDGQRFQLPDPIADLPGLPARDPGGVSLTYILTPTLRYDRFTDNDDWTTINDVEFAWAYSAFQTRNSLSLTLDADTRDGFANLRSTVDLEQRYQEVDSNDSVDEDEREELRLDAYQFTGEEGTQDSTLTVYPLTSVPMVEDSNLQYSLSSLLFERTFVELRENDSPRYETQIGSWSENDISTHRTAMLLAWDVLDARQTVRGTAALPPLNGAYTGSVTIVTGPLTTTVGGGYREDDEKEWTFDNLIETHALSLLEDDITFTQRLEYDIEESRLQQASSSLSLWPLTATLTGRHTEGYRFEEGTGWVDNEEEDFRWVSLEIGIDGSYDTRFWKRRVDLSFDGSLAVDIDLLRYTSSSLVLDYGFSLDIYRFLDFEFSVVSTNDFIYQYFENPASDVGRPRRAFIEDLVDSLRLFDDEAREQSFFKIEQIDISAVHDLEDWELTFTYSGLPELDTEESEYRWRSVFSILLRWRSIDELRRNIRVEDGEVEFVD